MSILQPEKLKNIIKRLGKERLQDIVRKMVLIRHFEVRGEAAYQMGKVGGFYHSYTGEEAIQTAAVEAFGVNNWYIDFYRCHALALLLGATPNELMAELFGKATGNAKGRGGSMHLYTKRMLGGFAIVGGHLPIAIGAAFSAKYLKTQEVAICFLGEGAVAQGAFHESLNLASLWRLPVIFIIENNEWGMGTHVSRAIAVDKIAEKMSQGYAMPSMTLDGMDFFSCFAGFEEAKKIVLEKETPILIECHCQRFKGHSISDPALYRTKEELQKQMKKDPIPYLTAILEKEGILTEELFKQIDKEEKEKVLAALEYAENSPWPHVATLEEDVYAAN